MSTNFSIVVCSYNPEIIIFNRVIKSLENLLLPSESKVEFIIVDNNSKKRLCDLEAVKFFLNNSIDRKYVLELNPGLTEARKRGFKEAKYDWIIFFDDDNEPAPDFLNVLTAGLNRYPELYCTGPGTINVEYQDVNYDPWFDKVKIRFQQRDHAEFKCSSETKYFEEFYPVGTGMVIKKDILSVYMERVEKGFYTLSDRKGRSLSSGGDLQIVFTCAGLGFNVGVLPGLKLKHLIPASRTTISYLVKQIYGTSSTCLIAHEQVFPGIHKSNGKISSLFLMNMILRIVFSTWKNQGQREMQLRLAQYLGDLNAGFLLSKKRRPFLLKVYEFIIGQ